MVLGDSTLEPLTPSVYAPLVEIFSPRNVNFENYRRHCFTVNKELARSLLCMLSSLFMNKFSLDITTL
jgi:hypothetical protein